MVNDRNLTDSAIELAGTALIPTAPANFRSGFVGIVGR
ncbi:MAG: GTPase Era, partial [Microcoleus sp. SIO2G3]|nr:GTPase Era [Microcoleus sp. SIO2G3]